LVVEFCKRLGDDFKREVVRRLLKDDDTEDEFKEIIKEFEDVIYPFVGHIPKIPDELDEDELTFLNNLIKEYPEVSYRIEDGLAVVRLKNINYNKFNKLSKMLKNMGYVYDDRLYK